MMLKYFIQLIPVLSFAKVLLWSSGGPAMPGPVADDIGWGNAANNEMGWGDASSSEIGWGNN